MIMYTLLPMSNCCTRYVFTGSLSSMTRSEAWDLVRLIGAEPSDYVSHSTDYLVLGHLRTDMSNKLRRALAYQEQGYPVQIIDEDQFVATVWASSFRTGDI